MARKKIICGLGVGGALLFFLIIGLWFWHPKAQAQSLDFTLASCALGYPSICVPSCPDGYIKVNTVWGDYDGVGAAWDWRVSMCMLDSINTSCVNSVLRTCTGAGCEPSCPTATGYTLVPESIVQTSDSGIYLALCSQ